MLDDYSSDIVRVVEVQPPRFYIPARGRSEEALDVAARFQSTMLGLRWMSNQAFHPART
ncbi:hypothetical protein GN244_ATG04526 [Phytophthora infestans]|uniref:Uncharacterized protein n=1 Tax=Phytophthora infestans TaxID=4787 RepID=A0A833WIJ3_PHYIN|nr:hypothetical protein GN244_ATG04526 [Phytophthora infestans]